MKIYQDMNDWWVGYYRGDTHHYVCLLPTIVIRWDRKAALTLVFKDKDGNEVARTNVRRGERPDVRRIILRPTNIDAPPARVSQALFRQRPTRKLEDDE